MTRHQSENASNQFAYAFWKTQNQGEERLDNLTKMITPIFAHLQDPTPAGFDFELYFNLFYEELATDPQKYGYYQFKQILEASSDNQSNVNFNTLVKNLTSPTSARQNLTTPNAPAEVEGIGSLYILHH